MIDTYVYVYDSYKKHAMEGYKRCSIKFSV